VRRVRLASACAEAGLPLEGIGAAMAAGKLTLAFLDHPLFRWSDRTAQTYRDLAEVTQRAARARGGLPVKWLGDGVMFFFRQARAAVLSALEMVQETRAVDLPPAHVGIHAGPIVVQDGDYFGRTVNLAARIAGQAGAGQVLVTDEVVAAAGSDGVRFETLGPVRLKGFTRPVRLHLARPAEQVAGDLHDRSGSRGGG
jgi:adenylate cyclase